MQPEAVVMERLGEEAAMAMEFVRSECAHTIGILKYDRFSGMVLCVCVALPFPRLSLGTHGSRAFVWR